MIVASNHFRKRHWLGHGVVIGIAVIAIATTDVMVAYFADTRQIHRQYNADPQKMLHLLSEYYSKNPQALFPTPFFHTEKNFGHEKMYP